MASRAWSTRARHRRDGGRLLAAASGRPDGLAGADAGTFGRALGAGRLYGHGTCTGAGIAARVSRQRRGRADFAADLVDGDGGGDRAGIWLLFQPASPRDCRRYRFVAVPHFIGAPRPHAFTSKVPAEIAGHFAAVSLVVHGLLWTLAGSPLRYLWRRQARPVRDGGLRHHTKQRTHVSDDGGRDKDLTVMALSAVVYVCTSCRRRLGERHGDSTSRVQR